LRAKNAAGIDGIAANPGRNRASRDYLLA